MSNEIVLTLRGWRFYRHWYRTVRQARRQAPADTRFADRLRVRWRSLGRSQRPIFILGCPRSGTTYLGKILAPLPGVSYFFEPPIMKYYTRLVYQELVSESKAIRFYRHAARVLMIAAPGHGPRMLEKNPKHTWVAPTLFAAFPDAQFVIITRDGRDVAASLSEKPWHLLTSASSRRREPGGYLYGPYPHFYIEPNRAKEYEQTSDLHRCIWIWRRYAEQIEQLERQLPTEGICHVRYEDLVQDPQTSVEQILRFLGEDDPTSIESVLASAQSGHVDSLGRWRNKLTEDQIAIVENEAGEMLRKLGYVTESSLS